MLEAIPGHDRWLDPPADKEHDVECPQHPFNAVIDDPDPCECDEIRRDLRAAAAEARFDSEREGA